MIKFTKINTLRPFDWLLIIGIILLNIIHMFLTDEFDWLGSIAGITGVICVVLVAKGNIFNYFFGLINVTLYAIISYKAKLYGDAALNAFYYLPMQFIGWFAWLRKRESNESVTVISKRFNNLHRFILLVVSILLVLLGAFILKQMNDPQPLKDSATTILSIIAMFLMVRAYMEQWALWVVVNIISVIMWSIAFYNGVEHSMLMVIMWLFYLANSVNGWFTWYKRSSKNCRIQNNLK